MWEAFKEHLTNISLERVLKVLFPEFSNKITWAIVGTGLAIISTSLIEVIVANIIEKEFEIEIFGENDALFGLLLVVVGSVHNIFYVKEKTKISLGTSEANRQQLKHDKELFLTLEAIMDETYLNALTNSLEINHAYYYSKYDPVEVFLRKTSKVENSYIDPDLDEKLTVFKSALSALDAFLVNNFSQIPQGTSDDWLCLHPYWNSDRAGKFADSEQGIKYSKAVDQMYELTKGTKLAFSDYRKLIKSKLKV